MPAHLRQLGRDRYTQAYPEEISRLRWKTHACSVRRLSARAFQPSTVSGAPSRRTTSFGLAAFSSAAINARAYRSSGTLCASNRLEDGDPPAGELSPMARGPCLRVMSAHRSRDL